VGNAALLMWRGIFRPDGSFVGRVVGIRAPLPGESGPVLIARTSPGTAIEIGWSTIASAKDIIITKAGTDFSGAKKIQIQEPARPGSTSMQGISGPSGGKALVCPSCGQKAKWVEKYGRWYCNSEKRYL